MNSGSNGCNAAMADLRTRDAHGVNTRSRGRTCGKRRSCLWSARGSAMWSAA